MSGKTLKLMPGLSLMQQHIQKEEIMLDDMYGPSLTPEQENQRLSGIINKQYEEIRILIEHKETYKQHRDELAKEQYLDSAWSLVSALKKELGE